MDQTFSQTPAVMPGKKFSGMVIDDSGVVRMAMTKLLQSMDVIGEIVAASNGIDALHKLESYTPDVAILDLEMPLMDGISLLPKLLQANPEMIVIVSSSISLKNAEISLLALQLGAKDYIAKPSSNIDGSTIRLFQQELKEKISAFLTFQLKKPELVVRHKEVLSKKTQKKSLTLELENKKAVVMGASTGGPQALLHILENAFRYSTGPIFIVQHMLPIFTTVFARHLQRSSGLKTIEVTKELMVENGHIYVAPGNYHMTLARNTQNKVILRINDDAPENFCRPSINPLFRSAAEIYGTQLLGVVLSGAGEDGLDGSRHIKKYGGTIVTQNRESCSVWGIGRAVVGENLSDYSLTPEEISAAIKQVSGKLS